MLLYEDNDWILTFSQGDFALGLDALKLVRRLVSISNSAKYHEPTDELILSVPTSIGVTEIYVLVRGTKMHIISKNFVHVMPSPKRLKDYDLRPKTLTLFNLLNFNNLRIFKKRKSNIPHNMLNAV